MYTNYLIDSIQSERDMTDYIFCEEDKKLLKKMLKEINECVGSEFEYLAELDTFEADGSGSIIEKYIMQYKSEATKAILVSQMVHEKIKDCDKLIVKLYTQFKKSQDYIPDEKIPAPAHIYVRYDNAFKKLKPKRIKNELVELIRNPRDAFYLPYTTIMLASWKIPEVKDILLGYLDDNQINAEIIGLPEKGEFYPSVEYIRRDLKFIGLEGLKYYPTVEIVAVIKKYAQSDDEDIKLLAEKILTKLNKS